MMELTAVQRNVIHDAKELALEDIRRQFIDDPERRELLGINPKFRTQWDPFIIREPNEFKQGFGLMVEFRDPVVKKIFGDDEMRQEFEQITMRAFQVIMTRSRQTKSFIETLLHDVVLERESFYGN